MVSYFFRERVWKTANPCAQRMDALRAQFIHTDSRSPKLYTMRVRSRLTLPHAQKKLPVTQRIANAEASWAKFV